MDVLALVLARVEAGSFREATPLAVQAIDEAAQGKRPLRATADALAGLMPLFDHSSQYVAALPPNDDERVRALSEVAAALITRGDAARAAALFAKLPICEHLQPVREELLRRGAHIGTGGHLWGGTAMWLWFNVVLDPAALQRKLALDACVLETKTTIRAVDRS